MIDTWSRAWRLALLTALPALAGCSSAGQGLEEAAARDRLVPAVELVQAREGALPLSQRLTGTVRASGEVAIFPQTSGAVAEVFVQNGDTVRRGDPLVRIQTPGSQPQLAQAQSTLAASRAALRQAESNLEELEAQFERTQALGEQGLVPEDTVVTQRNQVEAARANLSRARAEVRVAEATLAERSEVQDQMLVRAPISGQVGQRNAEVGLRVDTQSPLFVMGRLDRVRVEVPVTQEILANIDDGQRAEIGVPGRVDPIVASISRISPFLEPGSYSAEVEIDIPNEDRALVPGMFVAVDVFYGESERATLVPTSAIFEDPTTGEPGVFIAQAAPVEPPADGGLPDPQPLPFRAVSVVAEGPLTVAVRGLEPGAWVVVVGQHLLAEQSGEGPPQARTRAIDWDRVMELQRLQRQDLLREFMEKQQRLADRSMIRSGS